MKLFPSRLIEFFTFANERYQIFLRKERGDAPPWTDDPHLRAYHFANVFREDDNVSRIIRERISRVRHLGPERHAKEALAGRAVNRAAALEDLPARWWNLSEEKLAARLGRHKQDRAFIHWTPLGISNTRGTAMKMKARIDVDPLLDSTSIAEAVDWLRSCTAPKTMYPVFETQQAMMDLEDTGFWDHEVDDRLVPGPGAVLGTRILRGEEIDWLGATKKCAPAEQRAAEEVIDRLLALAGSRWPTDERPLTYRSMEQALCEYMKWFRLRDGWVTGRRYKRGLG